MILAGAAAWGVAEVTPVDPEAVERYRRWIVAGSHGAMSYLAAHCDVRDNPALLLEGARSMIIGAFSYAPATPEAARIGYRSRIARYALGKDYHYVLKRRLTPLADELERLSGTPSRICVDSAPLRERYWAEKAGLGRIGRNGQLIVPGIGSLVFIAVILTGAVIPPNAPSTAVCPPGCGACLRRCPAAALMGNGVVEARKCLSYLTIEYKGQLTPATDLKGRLYGCDACLEACPENAVALRGELGSGVPVIDEFQPHAIVADMTPGRAAELTGGRFKGVFGESAVMRLRVQGLRRNALHLLSQK